MFVYFLAATFVVAYFLVVPSHSKILKGLRPSPSFPENVWQDDKEINSQDGYLDLGYGAKTHYYILSPKKSSPSTKRLVFVHGLSTPPPLFRFFLSKLVKRGGFEVLAYDIYGRGFSDSPPVDYTNGFLVSQLGSLLLKLQWFRVDIIGYSLGGAITMAYAARFPESINRIYLIAPAGLMKSTTPLTHIVNIPIIGQLFLHTLGRRLLIKFSTTSALGTSEDVLWNNRLQRLHLSSSPSVLRAVGSTLLSFDFGDSHADLARLEETHHGKVCCIWGKLDAVVPVNLSKEFKVLLPSSKLHLVPDLSHAIVIEDSSLCAELIVEHFSL